MVGRKGIGVLTTLLLCVGVAVPAGAESVAPINSLLPRVPLRSAERGDIAEISSMASSPLYPGKNVKAQPPSLLGAPSALDVCAGLTPTITGTEGPDELLGTEGADVIFGLGGDDVISGLGGDDKLCAGSGNDTVDAGAGANSVYGGPGDDVLTGGSGSDVIFPGPGDDRIDGGSNVPLILDMAAFLDGKGGVSVDLEAGTASGHGHDLLAGIEAIAGSRADDVLLGDAEVNIIDGGEYVTFSGEPLPDAGDDIIDGRGGADLIFGQGGDDSIDGGPGDDVPIDGVVNCGIYGGAGRDTLRGGPGADLIHGGEGSDSLDGGPGDENLNADAGIHGGLFGNGGNDSIDGGPGDDGEVHGDAGRDTLFGGSGVDGLYGEEGDDELFGGPGNDPLIPGPGDDLVDGGGGIRDTVAYTFAPGPVHVNLRRSTASGEGEDDLLGVENVSGSFFGDNITGDRFDNFLYAGIDLVDGVVTFENADDVLSGGGGWDILLGFGGDDVLDGGPGVGDEASFLFSPAPVQVDLTSGTASGDGEDQLTGIEVVDGSPYDDVLIGTDKPNFFWGNPGDDTIDGGGGIDIVSYDQKYSGIFGLDPMPITANLADGVATGEGNDSLASIEALSGGPLADRFIGGEEDDALFGYGGADTLIGGGGDDLIRGGEGDDTIDGGEGTYDLAIYSDAPEGVVGDLSTGTVSGLGLDAVAGIEALAGSRFADSLSGDDLDNTLYGGPGDDELLGGHGHDWLQGDVGRDDLDGGDGPDNCNGGEVIVDCEGTRRPPDHPLSWVPAFIVKGRKHR